MTPAIPAQAALARLRTLTPGVTAAAILDADGRVLAGDASLAGATGDGGEEVVVVREGGLAAAVRTSAPVLENLLRADLAAAAALAAEGRSA